MKYTRVDRVERVKRKAIPPPMKSETSSWFETRNAQVIGSSPIVGSRIIGGFCSFGSWGFRS